MPSCRSADLEVRERHSDLPQDACKQGELKHYADPHDAALERRQLGRIANSSQILSNAAEIFSHLGTSSLSDRSSICPFAVKSKGARLRTRCHVLFGARWRAVPRALKAEEYGIAAACRGAASIFVGVSESDGYTSGP
jgi:hypothetical protein